MGFLGNKNDPMAGEVFHLVVGRLVLIWFIAMVIAQFYIHIYIYIYIYIDMYIYICCGKNEYVYI